MAKKQIETIGIRFDSTEAINDAAKLQDSLKAMGDRYKYVCDQLKDVSKLSRDTIAALNEEKTSLEKSMASVGKLVDNAITQLRNIDDILSDLSGAKFNELTRARNAQALRLKRISPDMEGYDEELEMLRRVNREIELRNKSFREMSEEEREALKITRDLIVANAERFSVSEIQNAIKFTRELRDLERTDSEDYQRYKQEAEGLQRIIDATKELSEAEKARIENERKSTLRDVDTASLDRLKEALKLTEQLRDASDRDTADYDNYKHEAEQLQAAIEKTKELSAIEQERIAKQRQAIVADPMSHSIEQIKEAIKATQELRDAQAPSSAAYEAYNNEAAALQRIIDATKELSAAEKARLESERQAAVADPYSKSVEQLKEALKLTEQLRDEQGVGSADYDNYKQQAEQLQKVLEATKEVSAAEKARLEQQRQAIVADPMSHSIEQIKEAIKATQELRDAQAPSSALYEAYNNEAASLQRIIDATKELSAAEKARLEGERKNTLLNIDTASVDKLKEALKLTEQLRDASQRNTDDYDRYKNEAEQLQLMLDKTKELTVAEKERISMLGENIINAPKMYSLDEIKEAIKLTEKLRNTTPLDSEKYDTYNAQLIKLKGILEDAEGSMKNVSLSAAEMKEILGDLKSQPLVKLEQVASQLEEELSKLAPDTQEFIRATQNLRYVNGRIEEVKKGWKAHDGQILATIKRLSAYVAVYGSYNFIAGKIKDMVKGWMDLSDTLADVQKTTGLAHKQLAMLSKDIDAIDTRTTQEGMHQLAAVAGQIGLRSREDILGFVKAADQLTVALNELGDDGVQSLAKLAQLTGDVKRLGVEQSLLAIGSSINELSAASSAAAGPIADFMRRTGGMANMANLSSADLAALGATADALGQPIETAATAMNKFVTSLVMNTDDVAYALNLDNKALRQMIDSGETMKAITQVLDAVRLKGDEGALAGIFKELGSEGTRMQQTMMALAENVSFLKTQVYTSRDAFEEATSATAEYNVKNETAAAIVERIGNTVREFFVTADRAQWLTGPLNRILDLVKGLTGVSNEANKARAALAALMTALFVRKPLASIVGFFASIGSEIKKSTVGMVGMRNAWIALRTAMSATNVVTLALTAVSAAIIGITTALKGAKKQAEQTAEAIDELRKQEEGEKKALDELHTSIKTAGIDQKERAELIEKFNSKYSSYLGFLVSETADVEELARAYNLLNAEIKLRYAQSMKEELLKGSIEEYASEVKKIQARLVKHIKDFATENGIAQKELVDNLGAIVRKMAQSGDFNIDTFKQSVEELGLFKGVAEETINELYNLVYRPGKFGHPLYDWFREEVELINAEADAMKQENLLVSSAEAQVNDAREAAMNGLKAEVVQYAENADVLKKLRKEELEDIINNGNTVLEYERNKADELIKLANKTFEEETKGLPSSDKRNAQDEKQFQDAMAKRDKAIMEANQPINALVSSMDILREAYAGDAWGKALNLPGLEKAYGNLQNLGTASVDNLVQMFQSLEKAGQRYTDVNFFNEIFGEKKKVQTIDEMHAFFKDYARQIKDRLKELGYTTSGNFDWSTEKGSKKKEEIKKEFEAAKSALIAYYEQRAVIIKQARLDEQITEQEMTRQIAANEQEKSRALVDFYSVMLGEAKRYDVAIDKIIEGKDLQKLSNFLSVLGPAMADGMRKGREQSEGVIRDEALRLKKIIEDAMLEGDVFGKLERDFRETLDELSLLARNFGDSFDAVDANMADGLVKELMKLSDKAYEVNEDGLKDLALQNTEYADWWNQVEGEQLTLLLEKLRGYYDDRLDVQRKYIQKAQREWKQQYKQSGGEAEYEQSKQSTETEYEQGKQSAERKYAQGKQVIAAEQGRQSAMSTLGSIKSAGDYNAERGVIMAEAGLEVEKITETSRLELEKISSTAERETQKIDSNLALLEEKLKARALAINAELAAIIEAGRLVLAGLDPNSEEYAAQSNLIAGLEGTAVKQAVDSGDAESVALSGEIDTQVASRKSIETQATLDANAIIMQSELDTNAIIQQSAQETTESILEQWSQRAEALSGWAEMVGDTMGEVWMLEKKANKARAQGDEETAKKLEAQAKESRQNLVKEALNKAIDMAKVWAMELGFKVMYNALAKKSDQDVAVSGAKNTLLSSLADIIANGFKGAGKEVGSKGIAGLATGAIIIAAAAGLAALAKSAVNNMFPEATEGVSDAEASAPKRKLTTGMLTYAEGKYPVLGNDGVVYDAEYAGSNMKTGVYRKPHFGIFAEKQPEMVIDGKTTQRLVLNYPEIYSGILELSRTGRIGMRTYATGNVLEIGEGYDAQSHQAQQQMQMEAMNQTLAATAAAVAALTRRLDHPIKAEMNYFGKGGAREAEQRGSRWAARNRVK